MTSAPPVARRPEDVRAVIAQYRQRLATVLGAGIGRRSETAEAIRNVEARRIARYVITCNAAPPPYMLDRFEIADVLLAIKVRRDLAKLAQLRIIGRIT